MDFYSGLAQELRRTLFRFRKYLRPNYSLLQAYSFTPHILRFVVNHPDVKWDALFSPPYRKPRIEQLVADNLQNG